MTINCYFNKMKCITSMKLPATWHAILKNKLLHYNKWHRRQLKGVQSITSCFPVISSEPAKKERERKKLIQSLINCFKRIVVSNKTILRNWVPTTDSHMNGLNVYSIVVAAWKIHCFLYIHFVGDDNMIGKALLST